MLLTKLKKIAVVGVLAFGLSACGGDGGTNTVEDNPPSIPELSTTAQPDVSFFQNNNPSGIAPKNTINSTVQNFNTAKGTVLGGAAFLSLSQIYIGFLNPASQAKADFVDGEWVWEYSNSGFGQSFSIRTTARPQGEDGFKWAILISGDDGQGNVISDFKLMEGTTSNGGAQGSWTFFGLDDQDNTSAFLTSSWTVVSETESTIELQIFDNDGEGNTATISYQKNGAENRMILDVSDQEDEIEVFWNTETNIGYVIQDGEKVCWDDSFQDTSCSEVGL